MDCLVAVCRIVFIQIDFGCTYIIAYFNIMLRDMLIMFSRKGACRHDFNSNDHISIILCIFISFVTSYHSFVATCMSNVLI